MGVLGKEGCDMYRRICRGCFKVAQRGSVYCRGCAIGAGSRRSMVVGGEWESVRQRVLDEERVCWICNGDGLEAGDVWTVDHVVKRIDGGSNRRNNLRRAHRSCNSSRS